MEAVATGLVARSQAHDWPINHLVAEQHDDPMYRAYKLGPVSTPAHTLGNGQARQGLLHQLRHQLHRGLALLHGTVNHPGTLVGFQGVELVGSHAQRGGKAGQRPGRVAGVVEGGLDRRTTFLNRLVRLGIGQAPDPDRQTARCRESLNPAEFDTSLLQTPGNALGEGVRQWFEGLWGQLFGAQFDQKILCCHD